MSTPLGGFQPLIATVDYTKVAADLTPYTAIFSIVEGGANDSAEARAFIDAITDDGAGHPRLRALLPDDTSLPWEEIAYSQTPGSRQLTIAVRLPTVSDSENTIAHIWRGDVVTNRDPAATYATADGWLCAYHMGEAAGQNAVDATGVNTLTVSATSPTSIAGQVGIGKNFVPASSMQYAKAAALRADPTNSTICGWVYLDDATHLGTMLKIGSGSNGWGLGIGGTQWSNSGNKILGLYETRRWITSGQAVGTGWHLIGMVVDASDVVTFYYDGNPVAGSTGAGPVDATTITGLGGYSQRYADYGIDEVLVHGTALTAEWFTTYFNNTSAPATFAPITFGESTFGVVVSTLSVNIASALPHAVSVEIGTPPVDGEQKISVVIDCAQVAATETGWTYEFQMRQGSDVDSQDLRDFVDAVTLDGDGLPNLFVQLGDDTELAWYPKQFENFSDRRQLSLAIRLPSLSSTSDTTIEIWRGKDLTSNVATKAAVYPATDGWAAMFPCEEPLNHTSYYAAAGKLVDWTAGLVLNDVNRVFYDAVDGPMGLGKQFPASMYTYAASATAAVNVVANMTMGGWMYCQGTTATFCTLGNGSSAGYALRVDSGYVTGRYLGVRTMTTGVALSVGWHHILMVVNGAGVPSFFYDGAPVAGDYSGAGPIAPATTTKLGALTTTSGGLSVDEVMFRTDAVSADWVETYYAMIVDPATFSTCVVSDPTIGAATTARIAIDHTKVSAAMPDGGVTVMGLPLVIDEANTTNDETDTLALISALAPGAIDLQVFAVDGTTPIEFEVKQFSQATGVRLLVLELGMTEVSATEDTTVVLSSGGASSLYRDHEAVVPVASGYGGYWPQEVYEERDWTANDLDLIDRLSSSWAVAAGDIGNYAARAYTGWSYTDPTAALKLEGSMAFEALAYIANGSPSYPMHLVYIESGSGETEAENTLFSLHSHMVGGVGWDGINYEHENGAGTTVAHLFTPFPGADAWHYVVFVRDVAAQTVTYYLDGELAEAWDYSAGGDPSTTGATPTLYLNHSTSGNQYAWGHLDEVVLHTVVRSADWIATRYNALSDNDAFWAGTPTSGWPFWHEFGMYVSPVRRSEMRPGW